MWRLSIGLVAMLTAADALAGVDTHYQDTVIGERASGMGGAFTALADEASGVFYNPAGIALAATDVLEVNLSAYRLRTKDVFVADLCGREIRSDRSAFFSFPATLSFAKVFDTGDIHHGLGLAFSAPNAEKSSSGGAETGITCDAGDVDVGLSEIQVDRLFEGTLSYAIAPTRWLQLGLSLGLGLRSSSATELSTVIIARPMMGEAISVVSYVTDYDHWSAFMRIGAIAEPLPGLRVGLMVQPPHVRLVGKGTLELIGAASTLSPTGEPTGTTDVFYSDDADYFYEVPMASALGVAYQERGAFSVSADVKLHLGLDPYQAVSAPGLDPTTSPIRSRDVVVNVNLGGEVEFSDLLTGRLGFFTNFSSTPADSLVDNGGEHIDLFGATIGVSVSPDENGSIAVTLQGQYGQGETAAAFVDPQTLGTTSVIAGLEELSFIAYIGGHYDLR